MFSYICKLSDNISTSISYKSDIQSHTFIFKKNSFSDLRFIEIGDFINNHNIKFLLIFVNMCHNIYTLLV